MEERGFRGILDSSMAYAVEEMIWARIFRCFDPRFKLTFYEFDICIRFAFNFHVWLGSLRAQLCLNLCWICYVLFLLLDLLCNGFGYVWLLISGLRIEKLMLTSLFHCKVLINMFLQTKKRWSEMQNLVKFWVDSLKNKINKKGYAVDIKWFLILFMSFQLVITLAFLKLR